MRRLNPRVLRLCLPVGIACSLAPRLAHAAPPTDYEGDAPAADAPATDAADVSDTADTPPVDAAEGDAAEDDTADGQGDTAGGTTGVVMVDADALDAAEDDVDAAATEPPTEEEDVAAIDLDDDVADEDAAADGDLGAEDFGDMDIDLEGDLEGLLAESVVAGASRSAETSAEAPAVTSSASGSDLQRYGLKNVEEAIQYLLGGLLVEPEGGQVGGRGVQFTGDRGSHVLLLLDGHFVNEIGAGIAEFGDLSGIPIEMIDRIEVIYGPGSVLYGSNAMLGVVNVVTKRSQDMEGVTGIAEVGLTPSQDRTGAIEATPYRKLGQRYRFGLRFGKTMQVFGRDASLTTQLEYLDDRTPQYQLGPQYDTILYNFQDYGPNVRDPENPGIWAGEAFTRNLGPNFYGRFKTGNFTIAGRTSWRRLTNQGNAFNDQQSYRDTFTTFVDARYDWHAGARVSGMVRSYLDHYREQSNVRGFFTQACVPLDAPCVHRDGFESGKVGTELQTNFDWTKDGRFTTMVGIDGRLRLLRTRSNAFDSTFGTPNDTVGIINEFDQSFAAYLQQMIKITPKVRFNLGARYDWFSSAQAFSPRAAAIFDPWKGGTLKLVYSQAFRAPTGLERLLEIPDVRRANPGLDPERVQSGELIIQHRQGAHLFTVAGFAAYWRDMISLTSEFGANGVILNRYENLDEIINTGANFGYEVTKGPVTFGVNGTYAFTRALVDVPDGDLTQEQLFELGYSQAAIDDNGSRQRLDLSPSIYGNAHIAYSFGKALPTIAVAGTFVGPRQVNGAYSKTVFDPELKRGELDSNIAPATARIRTTVSGPVSPKHENLQFRLSADFATQTRGSDTVGPFDQYRLGTAAGASRAEFTRIPRFSILGGLAYTF